MDRWGFFYGLPEKPTSKGQVINVETPSDDWSWCGDPAFTPRIRLKKRISILSHLAGETSLGEYLCCLKHSFGRTSSFKRFATRKRQLCRKLHLTNVTLNIGLPRRTRKSAAFYGLVSS